MARDPNHEGRRKYEQSLGPELGSLFAELWQELVWLHIVWQEYRVIYGTAPEQLDIANQAAGYFFFIVNKSLWEGVLLHLARLTDPPETGQKRNLSVTALTPLIRPELRAEVATLTKAALDATAFARDWRNRYIAHKDLPLALNEQSARPLPDASRAAVEQALEALRNLLNAIDQNYNDATTMFAAVDTHNGAQRLLNILKFGLNAEEEEERVRRKKWGLPDKSG